MMPPRPDAPAMVPYLNRTRLTRDAQSRLATIYRSMHHLRWELEQEDHMATRWCDLILDLFEEAFPDPQAKKEPPIP